MMRRSLLIAAVLLACIAIMSCAPKGGAGNKVSLSMYAYNQRENPVEAPNWDYALNVFQSTYPNVELKIDFGFTEPYHVKFRTMVAANQIPDLMFLWPDKRTAYITGTGKVKDLKPFLAGHEKEFAPGTLNAQGPKGEIYELPEQVTDTHVMYVNNKLMKKLGLTFPKTLDELIAQGPKIRAAGLIPIAMDDKDGWQLQSCLLGALVERTGGKAWLDKAIKGKEAKFTDAEFVDALTVIETLAKNQMFSPGIVQANYGVAESDFANEKAVYMIDGGWRINALVGDLKADQKPNIEMMTFPDVPNQKGTSGSTAQVPGTGYGMASSLSGAKADAAWSWIWFYSGPVDSAIRQSFGANPAYILPARSDLDPLVKQLITFVASTPSGYVIDSVMDADGMAGLHAGLQELVLGHKTAAQVAQDYETWVAANDSGRK